MSRSRFSPAQLGDAVARTVDVVPVRCDIGRFPDGEISVALREPVHDCDVFLLQPTSPRVDENPMELLALVDAYRRPGLPRVARPCSRGTGRNALWPALP